MGFIEIKKTSFNTLYPQPDQLAVDRTSGRSTGTVDRYAQGTCTWPAMKAGRPRGRPTESTPLSGAGRSTDGLARSTWRSTGGTTVRNMTIAPVGRPEGHFCPFLLPTGRNFWWLYICLFLSCFIQVFREQHFLSFSKFLKEFLCQKIWSLFQYLFGDFSSCFSLFQTHYFSHTWAIISILSIGSLFCEKNWFVIYWDYQVL